MKISNILLKNIRDFQTSLERMVTGLKINKPADDPAGFFVASRFNTQIKGLENANTNIQTALTMLEVADESMGEIGDLLNKMRDLIQKGCNGYLTPQERELNQKQINDLFARAVEIKNGTESNGIKIFDGGVTKLDKNKTYMDGQEVVIAAGQVLTTTGRVLIDNVGEGENIETEQAVAWGRPQTTEEPESVILNEGEESQGAESQSVILNEGEESQGANSQPVILSESEESQGAESQPVILSESEESQGTEQPVMMMSRSMSTFAMTRSVDAEDLGTEGTREFAAGETATVKINGMTYTITNNDTENATTLYYSTNNGQIVLSGYDWEDSFTVTAADGQDDNISLCLGNHSVINTGDGNDTVDVDWACGRIWVNTGAGNDTVEINAGYDVRVDLGDGEDNLINNQGYLHFVQRSEGTDTISGNTDNVFVYDEIYEETFVARQTKTITIGGKSYTVTNTDYSYSAKLEYAYNSETGQVAFRDWNYVNLNITDADGQDDDIVMYGAKALNTGDGDDVIRFLGGYGSTIDGGTGNNTYIGSTSSTTINNVQTINGVTDLGTSGSRTFAAGETATVKINGMIYTITNNNTTRTQNLNYSTAVNGRITLENATGNSFTVTAADGQDDNIDFHIWEGSLNTGDGLDYVYVSTHGTTINLGAGDDTLETISDTDAITADGGDGSDSLITPGVEPYQVFTNFEYKNGVEIPAPSRTVSVAAGSSETITVDGKQYTISADKDISIGYSYIAETGQVYFDAYGFGAARENVVITAGDGQNDNILLNAGYVTLNTGDGDDVVETVTDEVDGQTGNNNNINLGDGNDTIIMNDVYCSDIDGGAGVDNYINNTSQNTFTNFEVDGNVEDLGTSGSREFAAGETATVKINGMIYTITNNSGLSSNSLTYSTDVNGQITFDAGLSADDYKNFTISAAAGQNDNIVFGLHSGLLYTGDGNDTVVMTACAQTIDTGDGNDTVTTKEGEYTYGNTINLGAGDDSITIHKNTGYDYTSHTIDGGAGTDTYVDNSGETSNTFTNFENATTLTIAAGQTETVTIDGKKYDIKNEGSAYDLDVTYSVDENGAITFVGEEDTNGSNGLRITAHEGQVDNIILDGVFWSVNTGDLDDTITVAGSMKDSEGGVYGGYGNDTINVLEGAYVSSMGSHWEELSDTGTDTYNIDGTAYWIYASSMGSAVINVGETGKVLGDITGGDGEDVITISGSVGGSIYGHNGSDRIEITENAFAKHLYGGTTNYLDSDSGNEIIIDGTVYSASAGCGNDTIVVGETGIVQNGIEGGLGSDNITIKGEVGYLIDGINYDANSSAYSRDGNDIINIHGSVYGASLGYGNDNLTIHNGGSLGEVTTYDGTKNITVKQGGEITGFSNLYSDTNNITVEQGGEIINVITSREGGTANLYVAGSIYGASLGAGNDYVEIAETGVVTAAISTGDGDDTIIVSGQMSGRVSTEGNIHADGGNDNITINSTATISRGVNAGAGNDTVTLNGNNVSVLGDYGDDTVTINGNNNTVYGGDLRTDTSSADTIYDNGTGNTVSGFEIEDLGTSGSREFAAGETATVKINGMVYTITNKDGSTGTLTYSTDANGQITLLNNSSTFDVTAADGQNDNINFHINNGTLNTGDMDDIVYVSSDGVTVDLGSGDDTIDVMDIYDDTTYSYSQNTIIGGEGNDTLTTNVTANTISGVESITENIGTGGTVTLDAGQTKTVIVNGMTYTLEETSGTNNGCSINFATDGDQIVIDSGVNQPQSGVVTITAANGQADNIKLGNYTFGTYASCYNITLNTGDGNDTVYLSSSGATINLGSGDDTITLNTDEQSCIDNIIDGGEGTDIYVDNSGRTDNTFTNFENDPSQPTTISIAAGETKTITVDGKKYDVYNSSDETRTVTYSLNEDVITFNGSEYNGTLTGSFGLKLTAHDGQTDNIRLEGNWYAVDTGDGDDTITVAGTIAADQKNNDGALLSGDGNNTINILEGAYVSSIGYRTSYIGTDTITISGESRDVCVQGSLNVTETGEVVEIFGSNGDDTINVAGTVYYMIAAGGGNDTITVTETGNVLAYVIEGDSGDDNITVNGNAYVVYGNAGTDTITVGQHATVSGIAGAEGDDIINIEGTVYNASVGSGNDIFTVTETGTVRDEILNGYFYGDTTLNISGSVGGIYLVDGDNTINVTETGVADFIETGDGSDALNIAGTIYASSLGAGNDYVEITETGVVTAAISTGDGDDTIIVSGQMSSSEVNIHADGGNDNITINSTASLGSYINGSEGDDNITINSNGNTIYSANGDDTVILNGENNTVIGGSQTTADTLYLNNTNNTYSDFENIYSSESTTISIAAGETKTITVDGKKYDVYNRSDETRTVTYSLNDGEITFVGSEYSAPSEDSAYYGLQLTAHDGQTDNIRLEGNWYTVDTGDGNDTITVAGTIESDRACDRDGYLHSGDGDDTINILEGAYISSIGYYQGTDTGNDNVTIAGEVVDVYLDKAGTVNITSTGEVYKIWGSNEADDITVSGSIREIDAAGGNDNITITETGSVESGVFGGDGDDTLTVDGTIYSASLGAGSDTVIVNGMVRDHLNAGDGNDTITVENGATVRQSVQGELGDDIITITGSVGTCVNAGAGDDTINVTGYVYSGIYGESGVDNITLSGLMDGLGNTICGGTDDDTIVVTSTGSAFYVYGNEGNDTITIDGDISGAIKGEGSYSNSGKDTITVNSDGNTIYAGSNDDTITINGNNNTVYGGSDGGVVDDSTNDTAYNNGTDNTFIGVENIVGNSGTISVKSGETVTVEIDGKKYDIEYVGSGGYDLDVSYSVNDGQITFVGEADANGSNGLTITAHENQEDNLNITGDWFGVYTGDMNDTVDVLENTYITSIGTGLGDDIVNVSGYAAGINTEDGADTINITQTGEAGAIDSGDGNNNITVAGKVSGSYFWAGAGDDIITITETGVANYIEAGAGNDNITVKGRVKSYVHGHGGNDTIQIDGIVGGDSTTTGFVYGGQGDDEIIINGLVGYGVHAGSGNDNITINGTVGFYVQGADGNDTITVNKNASSGTVRGDDGDDIITISGEITDGYHVSGNFGNDRITITKGALVGSVNSGEGNDYIKVDSNDVFIEIGDGSNEVLINGYHNVITSSHGVSILDTQITINGSSNEVDLSDVSGVDKVNINGDDNVVNTGGGNDTINIYGNNNVTDAGDGDDTTSVVKGQNNMVFGGTGYDKVANYSSQTTYAEMDELVNGGSNYRVQIDGNISESSGYNVDLGLTLPSDAVFDISSVENAQNSLAQIDDLISELTKQRGEISFQNTMLTEILNTNLTRLTNLKNSLSTVRDADTAAEYNNLLSKASLIEQGQLLQAQLLETNASVVTQLISGIAS